MPRKIPNETKQLLESLYNDSLTVRAISRRTGVPYSTVYGYTKARQRVNPETGQPFSSLAELKEYQARQRVNPETGQPFSSLAELKQYQARQKVNPETEKPFSSRTEYEEYQARQRQKQPINQELSGLIKQKLKELDKTQKWLSEQLGITEGAVSRYISSRTAPRRSLQEQLFATLGLNYKTLGDLSKDIE